MASSVEKAQCVLWYHETNSPITVQRNFRRLYGGSPPDVKSIKSWYQKFKETGSVDDLKGTGIAISKRSKPGSRKQSCLWHLKCCRTRGEKLIVVWMCSERRMERMLKFARFHAYCLYKCFVIWIFKYKTVILLRFRGNKNLWSGKTNFVFPRHGLVSFCLEKHKWPKFKVKFYVHWKFSRELFHTKLKALN